jgi:hypothetical protein
LEETIPVFGDDPVEAAKEFARLAFAQGFNFDFTLNSLGTELDRFLESSIDGLDEPRKHLLESLVTAYTGETIRDSYEGEWTGRYFRNERGMNYYTASVQIGRYTYWPGHFFAYYFANGKSGAGTFSEYLLGKDGLLARIGTES